MSVRPGTTVKAKMRMVSAVSALSRVSSVLTQVPQHSAFAVGEQAWQTGKNSDRSRLPYDAATEHVTLVP